MDDMPVLNQPYILDRMNQYAESRNRIVGQLNGQELLAQLVMNASEPVTIVITGPLSNVGYAIEKYGEKFSSKV